MKVEEKKNAIREAIEQTELFLEELRSFRLEHEEADASFERLYQLLCRPYDDPNERVAEINWHHASLMHEETHLLNIAASELEEAAKSFYPPCLPYDWADIKKVDDLSKENLEFYVENGYDRIAIIAAALDLISIYRLDASNGKIVEKYLYHFLGVEYGTPGVYHMYQDGSLRYFNKLQDHVTADYLVYDFLLKSTAPFERTFVEETSRYVLTIKNPTQ